jgi:hypothetical protein
MPEHAARYLNDHLAGSLMALELIDNLIAGDHPSNKLHFLQHLRQEIVADREELQSLMKQLGASPSRSRQAMAWIAEKIAEVKLHLDDRTGGDFHWFEAMEVLRLGIEGKRLLWRALAAASKRMPQLAGVDFDRLEQRAIKQAQQVEAFRLELAQTVLAN